MEQESKNVVTSTQSNQKVQPHGQIETEQNPRQHQQQNHGKTALNSYLIGSNKNEATQENTQGKNKYGIKSLNLQKVTQIQQQQQQKMGSSFNDYLNYQENSKQELSGPPTGGSSPVRSTGRFQLSMKQSYNGGNTTERSLISPGQQYSIKDKIKQTLGLTQQELDPLVPRPTSSSKKSRDSEQRHTGSTIAYRDSQSGAKQKTLKPQNMLSSQNGSFTQSQKQLKGVIMNSMSSSNKNLLGTQLAQRTTLQRNKSSEINLTAAGINSRNAIPTLESKTNIIHEVSGTPRNGAQSTYVLNLGQQKMQFGGHHKDVDLSLNEFFGSSNNNNYNKTQQINTKGQEGGPNHAVSAIGYSSNTSFHPENKSQSPLTASKGARYTNQLPTNKQDRSVGVVLNERTVSPFLKNDLFVNLNQDVEGSRKNNDLSLPLPDYAQQSSPTFRNTSSNQNVIDNNGLSAAKKDESFKREDLLQLSSQTKIPSQLQPRFKSAQMTKNLPLQQKHQMGIPQQRSAPKKKVSSYGASLSRKQHRYYIDISDIEKMLVGSVRIIERSSLDKFLYNKDTMPSQQSNSDNFSSYIQEVAGGDHEAQLMLKFIEDRTGLQLQHILQMHLTDNRAYQVEDSALLTSVYFDHAKEQLCLNLAKMNSQIAVYIKQQFQGRQGTARIGFSSEKELFNIFRQMFGAEIFGQIGNNNSVRQSQELTMPRRVMNEIWNAIQLFRNVNFNLSKDEQSPVKELQKHIQHIFQMYQAPIMIAYLATKLLFHCRGKALFSSERKQFPLHKAVFEGKLPMISRLINCKQDGVIFVDKNEIDSCGNSPLVLAIRLKNIDAVKILTDLYCSAKLNPFPQVLSAFEIAKTMKDRKIVEILMNAVQKVKQHYMEVHKDCIFRVLERLPDFSIDLHFECTSNFIPWMKHFTPNDTYHIYKQGSNLRLDMRFLGYKKMKAIESNITVLFKGRNSGESEGELLLVEHDSGRVVSIFEDQTSAKIERDLDNIMKDQDIQKKYRAEKVKIEPECDRKGRIITQQVEEFTVQKFSVNSVYTMTKFKLNNKHVEMLTKYKTFEDYIKYMKVDIFSLGNPAAGNNLKQSLGAFKDQHAQVSSRPQMGNAFNATMKENSLLVDIEQGDHPGSHLQTQGDFVMDQRKRRDASMNNCQVHGSSQNNDQHAKTFRGKNCSCEQQLVQENANLGLMPIIQKTTRRTFNANMWLCQDHPLSIETFLPLLQVLSFSSKQIRKLEQAIDRYDLPRDRFPLKAKVPVFMLVEATFCFRNLQFGRQPDEIFKVDQRVIEQKRESIKQHYQLMQGHSKKSLTFQSEEDQRRQNQTLTKLYKQLALVESDDADSHHSDMSDGIELKYQEMLDDSDKDAERAAFLSNQEESKNHNNFIINNKQSSSDNNNNITKKSLAVQIKKDGSAESGKYSDERLTPANEYDVAMDSNQNSSRIHLETLKGQHLPVQSPIEFLGSDINVKTARKIGQVKTMSQINERHDKNLNSVGNSNNTSEIQQTSSFMSQGRATDETEQQYKQKLDVNQQLIERLTGKPLNTQENSRHTQNMKSTSTTNTNINAALISINDEISQTTAQERKKRRKELIRLYKLRKSSTLDKSADKKNKQRNAVHNIAQGKNPDIPSENILDSRQVDERPNVNETVEKRTLFSYINPIHHNPNISQHLNISVAKLNIPEYEKQQEDSEADANVEPKNSSRVLQPPYSVIKKEAGFISGDSSQQSNTNKKAGVSTADESSGNQSSGENYNSHKSFNSLTKVLQSASFGKGFLNNLLAVGGYKSDEVKDKSTLERSNENAGNTSSAQSSSNNNSLNNLLNQYGPSALRRRLEDQNHLQTIESEEVLGTEGTIKDRMSKEQNVEFSQLNPYQQQMQHNGGSSNLKNLANSLSQHKRNNLQVAQNKHSRQTEGSLGGVFDPATISTEQKKKVSLQNMLRPSVQPFSTLSMEEKDKLANPNIVLSRLHQYAAVHNKIDAASLGHIINNKSSAASASQNQLIETTVGVRKKHRGHTSYVSSSNNTLGAAKHNKTSDSSYIQYKIL